MQLVDAYRMRALVRAAGSAERSGLISTLKVQQALARDDVRYWRKKKHEHNWRSACKALAILGELRARLERDELRELIVVRSRFCAMGSSAALRSA